MDWPFLCFIVFEKYLCLGFPFGLLDLSYQREVGYHHKLRFWCENLYHFDCFVGFFENHLRFKSYLYFGKDLERTFFIFSLSWSGDLRHFYSKHVHYSFQLRSFNLKISVESIVKTLRCSSSKLTSFWAPWNNFDSLFFLFLAVFAVGYWNGENYSSAFRWLCFFVDYWGVQPPPFIF